MRARRLSPVLLLSLAFLTACGGGGGMHVAPSIPQFTSVPVTAASQGMVYTYPIAATDPAGGSVTFSLSTSPTGAALSGNTLTWTPAATQSRVSNSFTVTATTTSGGTATQSWTVSPTGTVTVNWVNTFWTATGPLQIPVIPSAGLNLSAVVPMPDGSLNVLQGSVTAPGVISIQNVPAGYYWLTFGTLSVLQLGPTAFWTSASTVDAGRDLGGAPVPTISSPVKTTFDFNVSGLDSTASSSAVEFAVSEAFLPPFLSAPASSTTLSQSLGYDSNIDWSQIDSGFLLQYEATTLGSLNNLVLGPTATLTNLALTNGTTNTISATLQASSQKAFSYNVAGSQWAPLFANAGPADATPNCSSLGIYAEAYVTGRNVATPGLTSNMVLASTALGGNSLGFTLEPFGGCDSTGVPLISFASQPAIFTDQNFGTLQYGDPFPSTWTRAVSFVQEATIPMPIPNSTDTVNFALTDGETIAPSNFALAPLVAPVQNPAINGSSIFTATTLNTTSPTLTWSAPTGATPYGYRVSTFVQTTLSNGIQTYLPAGFFNTAKTSVSLLPLSGGNTYLVAITALVDGAANMETSPYRSALPTAFASVVSAPITISPGATVPAIRGDARVVKRLSQPQRPQSEARAARR